MATKGRTYVAAAQLILAQKYSVGEISNLHDLFLNGTKTNKARPGTIAGANGNDATNCMVTLTRTDSAQTKCGTSRRGANSNAVERDLTSGIDGDRSSPPSFHVVDQNHVLIAA